MIRAVLRGFTRPLAREIWRVWRARQDSYEAGGCQVPPSFQSPNAHLHRGCRADPPRAGSAQAAEPLTPKHRTRGPRWPTLPRAGGFVFAGAPWLLCNSYPCRCEAPSTRDLIREAWQRAPLLERGVTSVNPSSRRALAPARWSPSGDRSVVLSALHRFHLRAVWDDTGLQIPPQRD